jgi:hypothetical protein
MIGGQMAKSIKQKQEEAEARAKAYDNLSPVVKLELIRSRRGKSEKEENKILKIMERKENAKR